MSARRLRLARPSPHPSVATPVPAPGPLGDPDAHPPTPTAVRAVDDIGPRIVRVREAVGLTQAELARRTGLSQSTLSTAEGGASNPRADTLRLVAHALGVPVGAFFGEPSVGDPAGLGPEDAAFVEAFRGAPADLRADVRAYLDFAQRRLRASA